MAPSVVKAVSQLKDPHFPWREGVQHIAQVLTHDFLGDFVSGGGEDVVGCVISQFVILIVVRGKLQGKRPLGYLEQLLDFLNGDFQCFGEFFQGWLAAELLSQFMGKPSQPVDLVAHVDGDTDRPALIGNAS